MNKTEFISSLAEILEISADGLDGSEVVSEIGNWDSLSIISFVAMVDSEFNRVIDPQRLKHARTVNDLAALVGL